MQGNTTSILATSAQDLGQLHSIIDRFVLHDCETLNWKGSSFGVAKCLHSVRLVISMQEKVQALGHLGSAG